METPPELRDAAGDQEGVTIAERDQDGESVIAVDFGPLGGEPSLDVVGDTAIVVVGDQQFEFDVPEGATEVTVNDSILTIREES